MNFIKNIKWVVGNRVDIKRGARMGGMPKCGVVDLAGEETSETFRFELCLCCVTPFLSDLRTL